MSQAGRVDPRPSVFLSHTQVDKPVVERVKSLLEQLGYATWYDLERIDIGDELLPAIGTGVDSTQFFAVFLSRQSVRSRWVLDELRLVYGHFQDGRKRILPILIEDIPPDEMPLYIRQIVYADLRARTDEAFIAVAGRLDRAIRKAFGESGADIKALAASLTAFQVRLLKQFESGAGVDINTLATRLGVTEAVVEETLEELISLGLVQQGLSNPSRASTQSEDESSAISDFDSAVLSLLKKRKPVSREAVAILSTMSDDEPLSPASKLAVERAKQEAEALSIDAVARRLSTSRELVQEAVDRLAEQGLVKPQLNKTQRQVAAAAPSVANVGDLESESTVAAIAAETGLPVDVVKRTLRELVTITNEQHRLAQTALNTEVIERGVAAGLFEKIIRGGAQPSYRRAKLNRSEFRQALERWVRLGGYPEDEIAERVAILVKEDRTQAELRRRRPKGK